MDTVLFLYDVEFPPYQNPPGVVDRFSDSLKDYFASQGLAYRMSALGGMVQVRGDVRLREGQSADEARQALAAWIETQPVKCTVRLGMPEIERDDTQYFRAITESSFEVNNLSEEDQAQAAAWHDEIRRWIESTGSKPS